jgi:hypothetical protein
LKVIGQSYAGRDWLYLIVCFLKLPPPLPFMEEAIKKLCNQFEW